MEQARRECSKTIQSLGFDLDREGFKLFEEVLTEQADKI